MILASRRFGPTPSKTPVSQSAGGSNRQKLKRNDFAALLDRDLIDRIDSSIMFLR
jgi:hypothetical protein